MSQSKSKSSRLAVWLSTSLGTIAICYLLSVPLAQPLQSRGYVSGGYWFELKTYYPLVWLQGRSPSVAGFINWYANLLASPSTDADTPYRTQGGII